MSTLSIDIKSPKSLSLEERETWTVFRKTNPALYSPYFHIGYTDILGSLRDDTYVLVLRKGGQVSAFLPFQAKIGNTGRIGFARPVGAPMTDYHGFIYGPDTKFNVLDVFKQAGFGAFHYDALVDPNGLFEAHMRDQVLCAIIDVSSGGDVWRSEQGSSYRRHLKTNRRRTRKAAELGQRRVEFGCRDEKIFEQLITWKRQKFLDTGKYDVLCAGWTLEMLKQFWLRGKNSDLRADMHVLYFGDDIAAIDLGLTDGATFHSWIVAYNSKHHTLAPGIQLLEEVIEASTSLGYSRIDMGEGIDSYKRHYASSEVHVSSGFIAASGPTASLSNIYGLAENFGERNFGSFGRLPGKARRRYAQISACEPTFNGRAKAMLRAVKGIYAIKNPRFSRVFLLK